MWTFKWRLFVLLGCAACLGVPARSQSAAPRPNELGRFPILEYHRIDRPEARWTRTPENFRADLERLWKSGYRTVALADVLQKRINIPAGTTPVVLTFDDSSPGQFRFIERQGKQVIDPDCAVGILEKFAADHPGFGHAATFYVLPGANPPNRLFNQPALAAQKLQYLASHGYEIGSHTLWHADLSQYDEATVRRQLARAQAEIARAVPGYRLRSLALPLGGFPKDISWALSGTADGVSYQHDAILKVAGGLALSPFDRAFDPHRLPRIQAIDSELRLRLGELEKFPERRFISDGDPRTIAGATGSR
jgi:peptidoglycan/xylan/chitin deacetylase (PgdA/CDA1 family)